VNIGCPRNHSPAFARSYSRKKDASVVRLIERPGASAVASRPEISRISQCRDGLREFCGRPAVPLLTPNVGRAIIGFCIRTLAADFAGDPRFTKMPVPVTARVNAFRLRIVIQVAWPPAYRYERRCPISVIGAGPLCFDRLYRPLYAVVHVRKMPSADVQFEPGRSGARQWMEPGFRGMRASGSTGEPKSALPGMKCLRNDISGTL